MQKKQANSKEVALKCPRCGHENLSPPAPCLNCDFTASPTLLEELSHVEYLLQEIDGWEDVDTAVQAKLRVHYRQLKREIEIELGLRPPPLTPEEAREAIQEIWRRRRVLEWLERWRARDWIAAEVAQDLVERNRARIQALEDRLAEPETPPVSHPPRPTQRLPLLKGTRPLLDQIHQDGGWTSEEAYQAAKEELDRRVEQLEIDLGLRRLKPKPRPEPPPQEAPAPPPRPSRKREPITWERVWETLLSERTLRALLFVGVFLIFIAAVTLVILNWRRYAPWLQVTFLTGFTLFFYGLGWYVRNKMDLHESGIALSATGALLIPIDFYTVYLTTGIFPEHAWAEIWLLASVVCLFAYVATAVRLRAQFFGYLVGAAIGSLCCALIQVTGIPTDWWSPTLTGLALLLLLPAHRWISGSEDGLGRTFGRPFRHLALLTATAVLLIVSGVRLSLDVIGLPTTRLFRLTLALDWWLAWAVYAVAAARHPRRSLTSAACTTAPVALYLTLALWAETTPFDPAWYGLGWALLVPLYLIAGRGLQGKPTASPHLTGVVRRLSPTGETDRQARTLVNWATVLILLAYGWALQEMSAAAAVHAVLASDLVLAALLWQRPRLLPVASLLAVSATITWMTTLGLDLARYSVGWATLSILHVGLAIRCCPVDRYTTQLYGAGFAIAALSLLPPLVALDRDAMVYALFNWIALAAWTAWLAHQKRYRGLHRFLRLFRVLRRSVLHWAAAGPLPILFWLTWIGEEGRADKWLGVGFFVLAWICLGIGRWLARKDRHYGRPWHVVSVACSVVAPAVAATATSVVVGNVSLDRLLLAVTLLGTAGLYFTFAYLFQRRWWLAVGGLVLPFGYVLLLDHLGLPPDPLAASLALVPTAYLLVAMWLEKRRGVSARFLDPLYAVSHVVAAATVIWGFGGLWNRIVWDIKWTQEAQMWAAIGQLILGVVYGLCAWFLAEEGWGHVAAWLGVVAAGLVAVAYSQGRGSSAFKAAVLAAVYVGTERALHGLRDRHPIPRRAWPLYRRPLLIAGWTVSEGTILLALVRNLWLLGGGPGRESWAIAGLLTIVALYAASAYLFRRSLFLWLAAPLLFAPWTLLTHRGWYVWEPPPAPRYALAWAVLAWALILTGFVLDRRAGRRYGLPLRVTAHVLLPFALAWGSADATTSSATFGLGGALYVLAAFVDCRRGRTGHGAARFVYPAAFLTPVWAIYLLAWRGPWLPHAHFGLLLLSLAPALFAIARRLHHVDPIDALGRPLSLPVYFATYGCAVAGTMLVSYDRSLLTLALLFDAGLALTSAWRLREPLWIYPAAALPPAALVLALAEAGTDPHRRGWWLIGLGAVYLVQSGLLRRTAARSYATPLMATAYAIVALGLPTASYEQIAALGAYGAASAIYALSAVWLQEPLLLTPAVGLSAVPYAILMDRIPWITPAGYGIALLPGVALALAFAHWLDRMAATGTINGLDLPHAFPWGKPARWLPEAARRLTEWWGLPFYLFAYVGAVVAAALSLDYPVPLILTLASATVVYGLATARFQLRGWLLVAAASAQLTALAIIHAAGERALGLPPAWVARLGCAAAQAAAFLPVSLGTAAAGLAIERRLGEGSPLAGWRALWHGWSRPFYWLLTLDLVIVQLIALTRSGPATLTSAIHALLLAALSATWVHTSLPYLAAGLGAPAVIANQLRVEAPATSWPWVLALLALGYGLLGYGLEYTRATLKVIAGRFKGVTVLENPLQQAGWFISAAAILDLVAQGYRIWRWLFRSLFLGQPLMTPQDVRVVQMAVATLAILGLLYLAISLVRRWHWLGYGAVGLLLAAWSLEWFLVWDLREIQWYAVPSGAYLLVIGYLEWRQDRRDLARWIDRAALLLLLGSAFFQSLAEPRGWPYALLMGAESFLILWWGSARRQLRFLYAGVIGIVTDVGGQLIEPLLSVNAWLVFGGVGLFVLLVSIFIERSLEAVRRLSEDVRQRLEDWE